MSAEHLPQAIPAAGFVAVQQHADENGCALAPLEPQQGGRAQPFIQGRRFDIEQAGRQAFDASQSGNGGHVVQV